MGTTAKTNRPKNLRGWEPPRLCLITKFGVKRTRGPQNSSKQIGRTPPGAQEDLRGQRQPGTCHLRLENQKEMTALPWERLAVEPWGFKYGQYMNAWEARIGLFLAQVGPTAVSHRSFKETVGFPGLLAAFRKGVLDRMGSPYLTVDLLAFSPFGQVDLTQRSLPLFKPRPSNTPSSAEYCPRFKIHARHQWG